MAIRNGTTGNDTLTGTNDPDTIDGKAGNDSLVGLGGHDNILGGNGNDTLSGGTGNDTLNGGAGNDTYIVDSAGDKLSDSAGIDLVQSSVNWTLGNGFENLALTGTAGLKGVGNGAANAFTGNKGANTLDGKSGNDTLSGGNGNDNLVGGNGNDSLVGGNQDDTLSGGNGTDRLNGGSGNDLLLFDSNDTVANGGAGTDTLRVTGTVALDLGTVAGGKVKDVEILDLAGNVTITLDSDDVLAMSTSTDTLRISGGAGDVVTAADGGWAYGGEIEGYSEWTKGSATLLIQASVDDSSFESEEEDLPLVAGNDSGTGFGTTEDASFTTGNVLSNDIDPEGATPGLASSDSISAAGAEVTYNGNGTFTYDPGSLFQDLASGETATDTFTYESTDGTTAPDEATVTITITGVNDAPTLEVNAGVGVEEGGTATITAAKLAVIDLDDDATDITYTVIDGPANGQLEHALASGVAITSFTQDDLDQDLIVYVHDGSATTMDGFDFSAADGGEDGAAAVSGSFSITIVADNDAPVAGDDTQSTNEDMPLVFTASDLATNDTDGDGPESLVVTAVGSATNGTVGLVSGTITFTPIANFNGSASFEYTVSDGVDTDTGLVSVTVGSVNDAPAGTSKTITTNEDTTYAFTASDFGFSDSSDSPANAFSQLKITTLPSAGLLFVQGGGTLTAGGMVSITDINAGNLKYTPGNNGNGAGYASFTFQVQDDGGTSNGGVNLDASANTITFNVTAVNDAPAINVDATPAYTLGGSAAVLDSTITISDVDSTNMAGATVSVTNFQSGDALNFSNQLGITGSYNSSTGVLTLSGTTTIANYETALESITFSSSSGVATDRAIDYVVSDGGASSLADSLTVDVSGSSTPPAIAVDGIVSFSQGGSAVVLDATITITDSDSTNLSGATVTINNFKAGDTLAFTNQLGITGSYNSSTGVLTLSGSTTKANYETALESITFSTTSSNIDDRVVAFQVNDGTSNSASDTVKVNIQPPATAVFQLSSLDGVDGFQIYPEPESEQSFGTTVSNAGDVNGDGFDDIVLGAPNHDSSIYDAGFAYVFPGASDLSGSYGTLSVAAYGFFLVGNSNGAKVGKVVGGAGDLNGDGFDDVIAATPFGDTNFIGTTYVVLGKASPTNLNVSGINGTNGFKLVGEANLDASGNAVSGAGDINGDGFDDLIVGAFRADPNGNASGASYVVFGRSSFTSTAGTINLSSLNGTTGFQINGEAASDYAGVSVSGAGDVNGDGLADLVVGAYYATPGALTNAGKAYVVFGKTSGYTSTLQLSSLNGTTGFEIQGEVASDWAGFTVSGAGDVNGDGLADMIIGAKYADPNGSFSGAAYLVFGASSFSSTLALSSLNGTTGFQINGKAANDRLSTAISAAGDVNGDGYDDLLVGSYRATTTDTQAGASYLIFGKASGFSSTLNVSALDGSNGIQFNGEAASDRAGWSLSGAGDVNGDGFDDILIGAPNVDIYGSNDGSVYVVYGKDFRGDVSYAGTTGNDALAGTTDADVMVGGRGNDTLDGGGGSDVLNGGAGNDVLVFDASDVLDIDGGSGKDTLRFDGTGQSLDLTAISDLRYQGIEVIDLTGTGNNSLTLSLRDVLALPDSATVFTENNKTQLLIVGNAGDSVTSSGQGWVLGSNTTIDGVAVRQYTHATLAAQLYVDTDITVTIS